MCVEQVGVRMMAAAFIKEYLTRIKLMYNVIVVAPNGPFSHVRLVLDKFIGKYYAPLEPQPSSTINTLTPKPQKTKDAVS